jgi:hypothetical protein
MWEPFRRADSRPLALPYCLESVCDQGHGHTTQLAIELAERHAFDEVAHPVLRVPSLSMSCRLRQRWHWQKNCPAWEGQYYSAAVAPDPGLRGKANHDNYPSVRGDSVKAQGPFSGAVGKTLRCGQWHTLQAMAAAPRIIYRSVAVLRLCR